LKTEKSNKNEFWSRALGWGTCSTMQRKQRGTSGWRGRVLKSTVWETYCSDKEKTQSTSQAKWCWDEFCLFQGNMTKILRPSSKSCWNWKSKIYLFTCPSLERLSLKFQVLCLFFSFL